MVLADLAKLLESEEDAHMIFKVGGESMHAHEHVVKARCPILGRMWEGAGRLALELEGVRPPVFAALMNYVYADGLPEVQSPAYFHSKPVRNRL